MANFYWITSLPDEYTLEDIIAVLNDFGWNMTTAEKDDSMMIFAGDQILFRGSLEECENFLTGMFVVLDTLPEDIKKDLKRWVDDLG